jgi:hypothetical protein
VIKPLLLATAAFVALSANPVFAISGDYITVGLDATHPRLPKMPGASRLQRVIKEMGRNSVVSVGVYPDIQSFSGHSLSGSANMNGVFFSRSYSLNGPHMNPSGITAGAGIPNLRNAPGATPQKTYTFLLNVRRK